MRFAFRCGALCALGLSAGFAAFAGLGCNPGFDKYPPVMGCNNDGGVCNAAAGGVGAGTGGASGSTSGSLAAGTGGAQGTTELTGNVNLVTAFDTASTPGLYMGLANIVAPGPMGPISVPYGGMAGTTFDLKGISSGTQWILVQDTTMGGANILSTYSVVNLPSPTPVAVPVVELSAMQAIATSLPSLAAQGVSTGAAQVVLSLTHVGAPYKGVSVVGVPGAAHIVYDTGPDVYTDTGTVTGSGGTIILFNAGLSGIATITLLDTNTMAQYQVQVQAAPGVVTLAGVPF